MKIHFTCSTAEFNQHRDTYFAIRDFLVSQGHILTRDWLPHTEKRLLDGQTDVSDIKSIYQANLKALRDADALIVEDTVSNFSTGHQITLGLQQQKPTLVLWQGKKHRQFKQMFIHGIESNVLEIAEYEGTNFSPIITTFIKKFEKVNETNRFHLVLSGVERQYLDWVHYHSGQSRTQIIIDSLHRSMSINQAYLKSLQEER